MAPPTQQTRAHVECQVAAELAGDPHETLKVHQPEPGYRMLSYKTQTESLAANASSRRLIPALVVVIPCVVLCVAIFFWNAGMTYLDGPAVSSVPDVSRGLRSAAGGKVSLVDGGVDSVDVDVNGASPAQLDAAVEPARPVMRPLEGAARADSEWSSFPVTTFDPLERVVAPKALVARQLFRNTHLNPEDVFIPPQHRQLLVDLIEFHSAKISQAQEGVAAVMVKEMEAALSRADKRLLAIEAVPAKDIATVERRAGELARADAIAGARTRPGQPVGGVGSVVRSDALGRAVAEYFRQRGEVVIEHEGGHYQVSSDTFLESRSLDRQAANLYAALGEGVLAWAMSVGAINVAQAESRTDRLRRILSTRR